MKRRFFGFQTGIGRRLFVFILIGSVAPLRGQVGQSTETDPALELEIQYIQALQQNGFLEYADLVMNDLRRTHPDIEARIKVLELQGLLARGRFDDARARIQREADPQAPTTWAMRLALADAHYAFGQYEPAGEIYQSFFSRFPEGPDPAINTFFRDAAYRYAQMLLYIGQLDPALQAYRTTLKADLDRTERRQIQAETGELMLRIAEAKKTGPARDALLKEARAIADNLLWVQDIWFGKGIVMLAHLRMIEGNVAGAQDLVEQYLPQLRLIDQSIREQAREIGQDLSKISPMAECRYLLGVMLHDEAERLMEQPNFDRDPVLALLVGERGSDGRRRQGGALQHFVNVFVRYADTGWAPEAGERADRIETLLENTFGATIRKSITPEQWARVRQNLFGEAQVLYNQNQFETAAERYLTVLNRFPDAPESISGMGNLARSFIEQESFLQAEAVIGFLAERFSAQAELSGSAGDELMRLAEFFGERGMGERRAAVYEWFFRLYTRHPMAPVMLLNFGETAFAAEQYETAMDYFRQVADTHTNAPAYFDAMSRMATIYERGGLVTNEIQVLTQYVDRLQRRERPGQALMSARFRLAQAVKNLGLRTLRGDPPDPETGNRYLETASTYLAQLIETLSDPDHRFQDSDADRSRNRDILEAALFSRGHALTLRTLPADQVESFKQEAIQGFEQIIREFPDSRHAPMALSQIGTLWTVLNQAERAQEALTRLRQNYPDSIQARNALFMLGRNLLEMGMRREAIDVFRRMFSERGDYAPSELLSAGQELLQAREFDLALQAFDQALERSDSTAIRGPALLGRAQTLAAREQFAEALAVTETLLRDFPRTTLTLDAQLLQSRVASEAAQREPVAQKRRQLFRQAGDAMRTVAQYRETPAELFGVDLEIGRILRRQALAEEQFGEADRDARLREFRGQAVAAYLQITLNADPGNPETAAVLEHAYHESIPLMLALSDHENVLDDCERYLETFPRGRFATAIRNWQNEARVALAGRRN